MKETTIFDQTSVKKGKLIFIVFRIKKNIPAVFLNVTWQFPGERTCKFLYSKAVALMFLSKRENAEKNKKIKG